MHLTWKAITFAHPHLQNARPFTVGMCMKGRCTKLRHRWHLVDLDILLRQCSSICVARSHLLLPQHQLPVLLNSICDTVSKSWTRRQCKMLPLIITGSGGLTKRSNSTTHGTGGPLMTTVLAPQLPTTRTSTLPSRPSHHVSVAIGHENPRRATNTPQSSRPGSSLDKSPEQNCQASRCS